MNEEIDSHEDIQLLKIKLWKKQAWKSGRLTPESECLTIMQ